VYKRQVLWAVLIPLVPLAAWAIWVLAKGTDVSILEKMGHLLPLLAILALILFVIFRKSRSIVELEDEGQGAPIFVLLLLFAGFLLVVGCELFFVDDVFGEH
jgi:uncharacterized membrane protein